MDINIMGVKMNDTVLYLARMLQTAGGSILIRDYTRLRELSYCIPSLKGLNPANDIVDYAGIGYTYSSSSSERYDTCIRLYDFDRVPDYEDCLTLVIADESRMVCEKLTEIDWSDFLDAGTKIVLLIKDYIGTVRKQYDDFMKNAGISNAFAIKCDRDHDWKCAILAEYNDNFIFTNISNSYKEALRNVFRIIRSDLKLSDKETEKLFDKAAKGGKK